MAEHEVPDLHDVEEKIHAAHDAEDKLLHTMPNAIHPDDNAFPGSGPAPGRRQDLPRLIGQVPQEQALPFPSR